MKKEEFKDSLSREFSRYCIICLSLEVGRCHDCNKAVRKFNSGHGGMFIWVLGTAFSSLNSFKVVLNSNYSWPIAICNIYSLLNDTIKRHRSITQHEAISLEFKLPPRACDQFCYDDQIFVSRWTVVPKMKDVLRSRLQHDRDHVEQYSLLFWNILDALHKAFPGESTSRALISGSIAKSKTYMSAELTDLSKRLGERS
jgi:hypothetical protein